MASIISPARPVTDAGLTVSDFNVLGIELVGANNIADAIGLIAAASASEVQSVPAIEALLIEILTPPLPVPLMPWWAIMLMGLVLWAVLFRRRDRLMA